MRLANAFFHARPTYVCKWPDIRAQIYNVRKKTYTYVYIGQRGFSASKEIYYYEHQDIIDQSLNGILSGSIAARVFVLDIAHLSFSFALLFTLNTFLSTFSPPPFLSHSISLRFNDDLLNGRIDDALGKRVSTDR